MAGKKQDNGWLWILAFIAGGGVMLLGSAAFALLVGFLSWLIFDVSWLVVSIATFLIASFISATIDLFETDSKKWTGGPCPYCGGKLRTPKAKQCPHCKKSWHHAEPSPHTDD
jgi:hypothetical protein